MLRSTFFGSTSLKVKKASTDSGNFLSFDSFPFLTNSASWTFESIPVTSGIETSLQIVLKRVSGCEGSSGGFARSRLLLRFEGRDGRVPLAALYLLHEEAGVCVLDLDPHAHASAYDLPHRRLYRLGVRVAHLDLRDVEDLVKGHAPHQVGVWLPRALGDAGLLDDERRGRRCSYGD